MTRLILPAVNAPQLTPSDMLKRLAQALSIEPPDLSAFMADAWRVINPQTPYEHNWHIDCVADHLHAVDLGQIQLLDINLPPRTLKSTIVTITWPVWTWIRRPWLRYMSASYSDDLATFHNQQRRTIIESDFYRKAYGDIVRLKHDQNEKSFFENTAHGFMRTMGLGGGATGFGCDRFILDDLINPEMAESKADRERACRFDSQTVRTRLDDQRTGVIVHVAQRLHKSDVSAQHKQEGNWTHLVLPMTAPKSVTILFPLSKREVHRKAGDLLFPQRVGPKEIAKMASGLGPRGQAAQLDQNPTSEEGGILKRAYWKFYRAIPTDVPLLRASAWDTASKAKTHNDFSANVRGLKFENKYLITSYFKRRMEYPQLRMKVQERFDLMPVEAEVIEDKDSGQSLGQDLRQNTTLPIISISPDKDKVWRVNQVSPSVAAGNWELPFPGGGGEKAIPEALDEEGQPWVHEFMENCAAFPDVDHDDDVDAFAHLGMFFIGKYGGDVMIS